MKLKLYKDKTQRVLQSTDTSLYEILPAGVIFPNNAQEVQEILLSVINSNLSSKEKITIHPKGAGTATAGQSLGKGIIINFTRHMNHILNMENNYVDVEPGIILGKLNIRLNKHGFFMPVDPSSSDVCSVGGMVANNSSGIHSYLYGDIKDYVTELEGYWADGSFFSTYTETNIKNLEEKLKPIALKAQKIKDKLPKTSKNSSGYNIKDAFNLNSDKPVSSKQSLIQLLVGSEGTLAVITKIRLKLIQLPEDRITVLSLFDDFDKALEAVKLATTIQGISAIELLDNELIEASKEYYPEMKYFFSPEAKAGLIFEIDGDESFVNKQYRELEKILSYLSIRTEVATEEEKRKRLWWIRRSAGPILNRIEGSTRSLRFIEDVGVPLDSIIEFYNEEKKILDKHGLRTAFFGHIGSGHFHINPRIDTRKPDFWTTIEKVSEETYALVSKLGGTLDAEHGDGILREPYIRKYQPELYELYLEIKNIFDPLWFLNPGKIVNRSDSKTGSKNIRYVFTPSKNLDKRIIDEVEKCHGCNDCVHFCEAYKNTGSSDEGNKARGRANLMRAIVSGIITEDELDQALVYIDACRLCGKCSEKCPTGIDIIRTASILREKGVLPIRKKEKLLIKLYSPYKKYLIWKLSKAVKGTRVKINLFPGMFKLGLYYIPYLQDLAQVIKENKISIDTNIGPLKTYLERYTN